MITHVPSRRLLVGLAAALLVVASACSHCRAGIIPLLPTLPPISFPIIAQVRAITANGTSQGIQTLGTATGQSSFTAPNLPDPFTGELRDVPSGANVASTAVGGQSPTVTMNASIIGVGHASGGAEMRYGFIVMPVTPQAQAIGPIPIIVQSSGSISITSGSPFTESLVTGSALVNDLVAGFIFQDLDNGVLTGTSSFGGATPLSVPPNALNGVAIEISGFIMNHNLETGGSGFTAVVDPQIYVDPDATFDFEGQTLRYIEHYGIAYSEGVEQWQAVPEPSAFALCIPALAALVLWRRRR